MENLSNSFKEKCIEYFQRFSNKDLSGLKKDFSEDIYLRDWEIEQKGIDGVINVIKIIFNNNESIEIKPINFIAEGNQVSAEIEILINGIDKLRVVDVIRFNDQSKIVSITAYKG